MSVLHKKLLRTLRQQWTQSLAVSMVVLCGIANYITIYSCYINLTVTRDTYYERYRMADFEIHLERAPKTALYALEDIDGIRTVHGRIVQDANVDIAGVPEPRIGRLISMPALQTPVVNDIVMISGRYFHPGAHTEVILSDRFATENGLEPGGRIEVSVDNRKHSLRIVGTALTPEYVYMIRNVQELVPAPERFGILWVPEAFAEVALDMGGACNNIVGLVNNPNELDRILQQAENRLGPYGVFAKVKREDQISNRFLSEEIVGLGVSARVVPTLFLGIAALILLVLLNRMVRTERTQIGLMKAYGYSSFAVSTHYMQYALILAVTGCIGGFFVGQWLANLLTQVYVYYYQFPILESGVYPRVLATSMGIALFAGATGALWAAIRAGQIHPAESMRPEAPYSAHGIWLERLPRLWRRFSFTWKMICRNIARNAFRAGLSAAGVAISTALLIMGFFTMDSMDYALRFQYRDIQREDVRVRFHREQPKSALYEIQRFPNILHAEPSLEYPVSLSNGWRSIDTVVIGMPLDARLHRLMTFDGEPVPIGEDGLVLSERLARDLGVGPGGQVTLEPLMGRIKKKRVVPVRTVSEQFLGSSAYMNIDALSRLLDEPFAMNAALMTIEPGSEPALKAAFKDIAAIASVVFSAEAYQSLLDTLAMNMQVMNFMLLIFAGIIAFSIIYNVTSVALAERQRELASLRVLGLSPAEVGRILYNENFLLAVIGILAGIPLGIWICSLLIIAYDTDLYRLPFHIERQTYVNAVLLTIGYVLLANLAVRRRIQGLDLVEVLKERE